MKRSGLCSVRLHGDAGSVDLLESASEMKTLNKVISEYMRRLYCSVFFRVNSMSSRQKQRVYGGSREWNTRTGCTLFWPSNKLGV